MRREVEHPKAPTEKVELTRVMPDDVPVPDADYDKSGWIIEQPPSDGGRGPVTTTGEVIAPVIVAPQIDTRRGLREPIYPARAIRLNQTGTVLLSVEVLPSGKVGGIRVVQSSGYPHLDDAAMQAAREWRLLPGTRDGLATAMWKQIPITFRLKD